MSAERPITSEAIPSPAVARWVWPVAGSQPSAVITQEYSADRHPGVDISVPGHYADAEAIVRAVAPGRVAIARLAPRGHEVLLDHGTYATSYHHLRTLSVAVGDTIGAGHELGAMGFDPLDAERIVHLHFQLAVGGRVLDPAPWLDLAVH